MTNLAQGSVRSFALRFTIAFLLLTLPVVGCTTPRGASTSLGSRENPIRMAFVPSVDSQKVLATGQPLAQALSAETGLQFDVSVPTSDTAVIEAMGGSQVEVAWLASFAYVLAHDKHGVEVILTTVRQGSKTYRSQIIARADSGI